MSPVKYTVFMRDQAPAGGLMQNTPDMGNVASHWLPYFGVEDPDASAATSASLSGKVILPPHDVPGVGRFGVIQDPQGATFGIARLLKG